MRVLYEYKVVEHYTNDAPEDFGFVTLEKRPEEGDVIQLYWLNKRPAYKVVVLRIDYNEQKLDVQKEDDAKLQKIEMYRSNYDAPECNEDGEYV